MRGLSRIIAVSGLLFLSATASLEDVLLQKKMLATNYDYRLSVGLSYTFGSIYSNVVNPRFGK